MKLKKKAKTTKVKSVLLSYPAELSNRDGTFYLRPLVDVYHASGWPVTEIEMTDIRESVHGIPLPVYLSAISAPRTITYFDPNLAHYLLSEMK